MLDAVAVERSARIRNAATGPWGIVVTRTPLRVSFAGGGTDLADFYERDYGAVFSTAIRNYIYVTVKRHSPLFDEPIRLNYRFSEEVDEIDEIENNIARECLRLLEIEPPIYISTVADHPSTAGLGGSSSFAVGLLHALHTFRGERVSAGQLAEEASRIEIDVLGHPIGKQDQYATAFGGLNFFCFKPGGGVTVEPHRLSSGAVWELFDQLLMFWTGHQPDTAVVLTEQRENIDARLESLRVMRDYAHDLHELVSAGPPFDAEGFGRILHESWHLKRGLASGVSTSAIDLWYERALGAGAEGGKICGAGGGGCLLLVVKTERQDAVRKALRDLPEVEISHEAHGSQVLLSPTR
jgi:D-glycero-alpha-D-manno-heptose-7-phosphate kinase